MPFIGSTIDATRIRIGQAELVYDSVELGICIDVNVSIKRSFFDLRAGAMPILRYRIPLDVDAEIKGSLLEFSGTTLKKVVESFTTGGADRIGVKLPITWRTAVVRKKLMDVNGTITTLTLTFPKVTGFVADWGVGFGQSTDNVKLPFSFFAAATEDLTNSELYVCTVTEV